MIKLAKNKWESGLAKLHLVEKWARNGISEENIAKKLGNAVATLEDELIAF